MRIYYVMEDQGQRHHVRTALGVDARAWNRLDRRVREWRRQLEQRYGIPAAGELHLDELASGSHQPVLSCSCGCHSQPASTRGAEMVAQGLRVVEDFAVENGGVHVINVCLDRDDVPHCRQIALDRLFNRVNATAAQERSHALTIFGREPEDMVVRTCERLRNYNPVPARTVAAGDGWHTRNIPVDRVICGPLFRSPDNDCLLQVAGMVAHALLWREEPPYSGTDTGIDFSDVFSVLDRALYRRASRNDVQGVVRR